MYQGPKEFIDHIEKYLHGISTIKDTWHVDKIIIDDETKKHIHKEWENLSMDASAEVDPEGMFEDSCGSLDKAIFSYLFQEYSCKIHTYIREHYKPGNIGEVKVTMEMMGFRKLPVSDEQKRKNNVTNAFHCVDTIIRHLEYVEDAQSQKEILDYLNQQIEKFKNGKKK